MLLGAHLAGVAFANAPVAGVHALAYPLGGHFHVPHGLSNALMLTHVLGHNMQAAMPLYAELGALLDPALARSRPAGRRRRASSQRLARLLARDRACRGGCPRSASAPSISICSPREAMKQERLLVNNPCPISEADARRLYEAAL